MNIISSVGCVFILSSSASSAGQVNGDELRKAQQSHHVDNSMSWRAYYSNHHDSGHSVRHAPKHSLSL